MRIQITFILLTIVLYAGCKDETLGKVYDTETLTLERVSPNTYVHTSYLETDDFGKVGCNGLIYANGDEAVIFDTPVDDAVSRELLAWVDSELDVNVVAIIPTHSHRDCLAGLEAFHDAGIPSYANLKTIEFASRYQRPIPLYGFEGDIQIKVGDKEARCAFVGQGHTIDNVVGYIPSENVLFGGCLVKSVGASKGYIGEANIKEWPKTVEKLLEKYPDTKVVVPGHGETGGLELLNYTTELFSEKN